MCVCMQLCVQPSSGLPHRISMGQTQRVVQLTEPPYAHTVRRHKYTFTIGDSRQKLGSPIIPNVRLLWDVKNLVPKTAQGMRSPCQVIPT